MHSTKEMKQASDRLLYAAYTSSAGNERDSIIAEFAGELKDLGWNQSETRRIVNGVLWILKPPPETNGLRWIFKPPDIAR